MTIPEHHQWLPGDDAHDLKLDSYGQQWFSRILEDLRMPLEERIVELLLELPAMPLANGSYSWWPVASRSMADIIEGAGDSSKEENNKCKPNSDQQGQKFVERWNCCLRHPGMLPAWLETIHNTEAAMGSNSNNLFWGMYGPGFTHDLWTNIMYMDHEAVEASCLLADGMVVPVPVDMVDWLNAYSGNSTGFLHWWWGATETCQCMR